MVPKKRETIFLGLVVVRKRVTHTCKAGEKELGKEMKLMCISRGESQKPRQRGKKTKRKKDGHCNRAGHQPSTEPHAGAKLRYQRTERKNGGRTSTLYRRKMLKPEKSGRKAKR